MSELITSRRELLLAPVIAALPMALLGSAAGAAGPDPAMTIVKLPDQLVWGRNPGGARPRKPGSTTTWSNGIPAI